MTNFENNNFKNASDVSVARELNYWINYYAQTVSVLQSASLLNCVMNDNFKIRPYKQVSGKMNFFIDLCIFAIKTETNSNRLLKWIKGLLRFKKINECDLILD